MNINLNPISVSVSFSLIDLLGPFIFTLSKIKERTSNNTSCLIWPGLMSFWLVYTGEVRCLRSRMPFPGNRIFPKNLGNFPSRAFGNILCPVPTQYQHLGLPASRSRWRLGNIREFPNTSGMKIIIFYKQFW